MKTTKGKGVNWARIILLGSAFVTGAFIGLGLFYPDARPVFILGLSASGMMPLFMIIREIVDLAINPGEESQKFAATLAARLGIVVLYQLSGMVVGLMVFTLFSSVFNLMV
jgi:hypothetical protein